MKTVKQPKKQIEFDDDIVVVTLNGKELYRGLEDYEPLKDEPWEWNAKTKEYTLNKAGVTLTKTCYEV